MQRLPQNSDALSLSLSISLYIHIYIYIYIYLSIGVSAIPYPTVESGLIRCIPVLYFSDSHLNSSDNGLM